MKITAEEMCPNETIKEGNDELFMSEDKDWGSEENGERILKR